MMHRKIVLLSILIFALNQLEAQYWQQEANYTMRVGLDVETHILSGSQVITYTNNSPDTLKNVYYHLYFNAFQPGSMMDVRSQSISDPDRRIGARIAALETYQQGYQKIKSLSQDSKKLKYKVEETILEVELAKAIAPGQKANFEMEFEAQVPIQIRRSGRQNHEGIAYSMAQWYPKMCEYDEMGWHTPPYVAREFHGVWGSFDVKITLPKEFVIGGTGVLQNPCEIGHGYCEEAKVKRLTDNNLTWHFKADKVHDFVWAADPDYTHTTFQMKDGPLLHFFYQEADTLTKFWKDLPPKIAEGISYLNENFGTYPYPQYSVIQAGDGGMEYPMATFITGRRRIGSLVGVCLHEMAHSWFQMVLASNENLYSWMDEGFTSYASNLAFRAVMWNDKNTYPFTASMKSYISIVNEGMEEPMNTPSDWFKTNRAYGVAAYSKGELFLVQLEYMLGNEVFKEGMLKYFEKWQFRHPRPLDFIRVMEEVSGLHLYWFLDRWTNSTEVIDYGIKQAIGSKKEFQILIEKKGGIPMPLEVEVIYRNGKKDVFYIPITLLRGEKSLEEAIILEDWPWTNDSYILTISKKAQDVASINLNPTGMLADVVPEDNYLEISDEVEFYYEKR